MMQALSKRFLHVCFGDYGLYFVYAKDLADVRSVEPGRYVFRAIDREDLLAAADRGVQDRAWYAGEGALGFGLFEGNELLAIQWYWHGRRYATRNFWRLREKEAKSVELYTVPHARGRGLATLLKLCSEQPMRELGFVRLYSRIWFSHRTSIAVSEKAGWERIALVAQVQPLGLGRSRRVVLRRFARSG